ncbi:MAG: hypothetical protein ACO1NX_02540 [Chitinophagaceae bacterium]
MKAASISEIKAELKEATPAQLTELCLRLARFKKENKELLTFLLFEAHDLQSYMQAVKSEVDEALAAVNWSNLYFAKKSIRKILRTIARYSRYAADKQVEAELLLYFCSMLKTSGKPFARNPALAKLYAAQLKKINTLVASLHEDLQYDYLRELENLK